MKGIGESIRSHTGNCHVCMAIGFLPFNFLSTIYI